MKLFLLLKWNVYATDRYLPIPHLVMMSPILPLKFFSKPD